MNKHLKPEEESEYPQSAVKYRAGSLFEVYRRGAVAFHEIPISIIENRITQLVELEGPLHKNTIMTRITDLYHVRSGSRVTEKINSAIFHLIIFKRVKSIGEFLYPINHSKNVLRIYDGITKRPINEIPTQEIILAIMECVRASFSITTDDLVKETARLFGLQARNTTSYRIIKVIEKMIDDDYLEEKFGKILLGSKTK